jgi:hypothetical protein
MRKIKREQKQKSIGLLGRVILERCYFFFLDHLGKYLESRLGDRGVCIWDWVCQH